MHAEQQPEYNVHGDEEHPAYGMIHASRVSVGGAGGGAVLFDSDIKHGHTVRVVIEGTVEP